MIPSDSNESIRLQHWIDRELNVEHTKTLLDRLGNEVGVSVNVDVWRSTARRALGNISVALEKLEWYGIYITRGWIPSIH